MDEKIFETLGGVYCVNPTTGLFTRKDKFSTPVRFLGSFESNRELDVGYFQPFYLTGFASGFSPYFHPGNKAFGITCEKEDIVFIGDDKIVFSDDFKKRICSRDLSIKTKLTTKISGVFRQLEIDERGYNAQDELEILF